MNLEYLEKLCRATGCSGYEQNVQEVFIEEVQRYAHQVKRDNLGNVTAILNPDAQFKVLITGHADEIGFIITNITEDGFLKFDEIGGIDKKVVPGSHVLINHKIKGIIGKKAIHLEKKKEEDKIFDLDDLFIDIGANSKKEAEQLVNIGDTVNFTPNFEILRNDIFTSKSCDNRVGLYVITEVLKLLQGKTDLGIYALSATQEEVGYRGAIVGSYEVKPDVGIAIDVTHATDTPDSDNMHDIKLGRGAVLGLSPVTNVKLANLIKETAKEKNIKLQLQASGCPFGTDTNVIQTTRSGVATALISIPNRYMHTQVETCSLKDLDETAKLIAETILQIKLQFQFLP